MLTDFCKPTLGGVEQHVFSLSKKLCERGHQVAIGTVRQKGMGSIDKYDGVSVYRFDLLSGKLPLVYPNPARKYHLPLRDFQLQLKVENFVKNFKPDIIHCHGWITYSYLPLRSKFDMPVISTLHHYGFLCPKQDMFFESKGLCKQPLTMACYHCSAKIYGLLKSAFMTNLIKIGKKHLSAVDKFIAVSNFVKTIHNEHTRLPKNKITVIPNFYEPEADVDLSCGDLPSDFILYIGQLSPHKGLDLLLTAFKSSGIDLPLVIIGGKHYAYDYGKFNDGQRIIVRENAPRPLVLNALKRCRFVVAPSIWPEPCPTTLFEAMSFGKPVLGSLAGGIPEIVENGKTGFLMDPENTSEFCEYLKLFTTDLKLCEEMGRKGKMRFSKYFAAEKVVADIECFYRSLLVN
ncbi:glycosyltransferase family 4 protein [Candidatus Bathyarchaeota archaeon A05DMB-2]|jgi:glycosyltransferase involved in cell wall biosynthesis|nr:glycosyltransferase family 4 protein [Candidatus Bathyarchaeota archaeon A05DMB-2]